MQTKLLASLLGAAASAAALTALALWPSTETGETDGAMMAAAQPAAARGGALQQDIAVQGHWNIEVRNPDGSVAQRREFDNAFTNDGQIALQRLLLRENKVSRLGIAYSGPTNSCSNDAGQPTSCSIVQLRPGEASQPETGARSFNLAVSAVAGGVRLVGTKVAARDGDVDWVSTWIDGCDWGLDAAACLAATPSSVTFTIHTLAAADRVPVVAGQQVMFSIDLSFSAAP